MIPMLIPSLPMNQSTVISVSVLKTNASVILSSMEVLHHPTIKVF